MSNGGGTVPLGGAASIDDDEFARSRAMLRRLELDINRRLDGILHGNHRGLVPGHGSDPGEARPYQPGDDVRRIDWNVTARTNTMHVRDTIAERELETWLCVDRSASLMFGTQDREKADVLLAAAAGVGFLTARGGNRIGGVVASSDGCTVMPARQGRTHLLALLARIDAASTRSGAAQLGLAGAIERTNAVARRRGLVVVLSDFLDDPDEWRRALATTVGRHHVVCIEIVDPRELELPDSGVLTLIDTESGRTREINTSSRRLRERYSAAAAEQRSSIATAIRSAGAEHIQLRTDRDWLLELARFVSTRRRLHANVGTGGRPS